MTLRQLLLIFRARWRTIGVVFSLIVGAAFAVLMLLPKQYTATASVLVDVKSVDPVSGVILPTAALPAYLATQVDIATSDRVIYQVIKMLGIDQDKYARQQWQEAGEGKGTLETYYSELMQKRLDVQPSPNSNVINISFTSLDPKLAAVTANAFAQALVKTNVDLTVNPAKENSSWFGERLKQLRDNVEKAQQKLSAYQSSHGIVGSDDKADVENARLAELSTQLLNVQAQHAESASRHQQALGNAANSPDVLQSPVIAGLRADVARSEARVKQLSAIVGANHPQFQSAQLELAELRAKLASEMVQVTSSIGTTNRVNIQRESELHSAVAAQKSRVLAIQQERDQLNLLQRDVENAQRTYNAATDRMSQTNLTSQTQQTNVAVLSAAAEPIKPAKPKILITMLIAIIAAMWVAAATALVSELADRRVRSIEDLTEYLDLPVLAVLKTTTYKGRQPRLPRRGGRQPIALPQ